MKQYAETRIQWMELKDSGESLGRTDYAETFYKRAAGLLPELELTIA